MSDKLSQAEEPLQFLWVPRQMFPSFQSMYIRLEWEVIKDEWQRGFPVNAGWQMTAFQDFAM